MLHPDEIQVLTKVNDTLSAITARGLDPSQCEGQARAALRAFTTAQEELETATAEYNLPHDPASGPGIPYQLRLSRLQAARRAAGTAAGDAARACMMAVRVRAMSAPSPQVSRRAKVKV